MRTLGFVACLGSFALAACGNSDSGPGTTMLGVGGVPAVGAGAHDRHIAADDGGDDGADHGPGGNSRCSAGYWGCARVVPPGAAEAS